MAGKYTHQQWISLAEARYPGQFDYSQTKYVDSYHKVIIRCKKHDCLFSAGPSRFLTTSINSCPECNGNRLNADDFLSRAKKRHPLLDFSKTKYRTYLDDVVVSCSEHGEFLKQAKCLVRGQEKVCPGCIKSEQEEAVNRVAYYTTRPEKGSDSGTFYKLKVTHKPSGILFIKVGITSITPYKRYKDKRYLDFEFEVLDEVHTTNLKSAILERDYKRENKHKRFYLPRDIWFAGRTELYELDGYYQLFYSQVKFIRDSLLEKQNGKCPLCSRDVVMPTLDHYHSKRHYGSGLVRGVLCNTCNRITGVIENNLVRNSIDFSDAPDFLRQLADYLLNKRENYIHPTEKLKAPKLMKSSYNKLVKAVAGKQKVPKYTGKFTKQIQKLYEKYGVEPVLQSRL